MHNERLTSIMVSSFMGGILGLSMISYGFIFPTDISGSVVSAHWLLGIGIAIYLATTIAVLLAFKANPDEQEFDFSGFYTDSMTHFWLIVCSILAYIIILIIQVRKAKIAEKDAENSLRQQGLIN